ncbi:MAG: 2-C-methyl-D-erythritol 2,4-cyclodiphosphate synthase [Planctomycetota bacterium]
MPQEIRAGIGFDIHRLVRGRRLVLGGVEVPAESGLLGHSDGDALLHAVTDALLGAIGAGDIGELFPDTAPENKDRDSSDFVREAARRARAAGFRVQNLDATVILESPRLSAHKGAIRARLAELCECDPSRVNVKAKTGEGLDAVGRGEALAARAVVLLAREG